MESVSFVVDYGTDAARRTPGEVEDGGRDSGSGGATRKGRSRRASGALVGRLESISTTTSTTVEKEEDNDAHLGDHFDALRPLITFFGTGPRVGEVSTQHGR